MTRERQVRSHARPPCSNVTSNTPQMVVTRVKRRWASCAPSNNARLRRLWCHPSGYCAWRARGTWRASQSPPIKGNLIGLKRYAQSYSEILDLRTFSFFFSHWLDRLSTIPDSTVRIGLTSSFSVQERSSWGDSSLKQHPFHSSWRDEQHIFRPPQVLIWSSFLEGSPKIVDWWCTVVPNPKRRLHRNRLTQFDEYFNGK